MNIEVTIYKTTLYKRKDEASFEAFMLNEVFTFVNKSHGRAGKITSLKLQKGNNTGHTNQYLLRVEGGVNGGAANQQVDKIKAFVARLVPMNDYIACGSWPAGT